MKQFVIGALALGALGIIGCSTANAPGGNVPNGEDIFAAFPNGLPDEATTSRECTNLCNVGACDTHNEAAQICSKMVMPAEASACLSSGFMVTGQTPLVQPVMSNCPIPTPSPVASPAPAAK